MRRGGYDEREGLVMLAELGVNFAARDEVGRGPLHFAARGDARRVRELMGLGLDVAEKDGEGFTAVDVAAACGNRAVLELFANKGAEG